MGIVTTIIEIVKTIVDLVKNSKIVYNFIQESGT